MTKTRKGKREPKGAMEKAFEASERLEQQLKEQGYFEYEKGADKMTKAMLVNAVSNEEVFVELNRDDLVVVTRQDVGSTVYSKRHTVESVVAQFASEGWINVTEQQQVMKNVEEPLPEQPELMVIEAIAPIEEEEADEQAAMVAEVDAYTELHAEIAKLNKELEKKKKSIRTYMDDNKLKVLTGTLGKEIYLQTNKATNSSSEYTTYDVNMIKDILSLEQYSEVTEVRVSTSLLKKKITDNEFSEGELKAIERAEFYKLNAPKFTVRKTKEEK